MNIEENSLQLNLEIEELSTLENLSADEIDLEELDLVVGGITGLTFTDLIGSSFSASPVDGN